MVFLVKLIDKHVGNFVCNFLAVFHKPKPIDKSRINRILVVQLWGIGETILTLPSVDALRKNFPNAEIDVLATSRNRDVFFNNNGIGNVKLATMNPFSIIGFIFRNLKRYDLAVDMEEYLNVSAIISFFAARSAVGFSHGARAKLYTEKVKYNDKQHAVQTFLDLARVFNLSYNADKLPELNFSKNDKRIVDNFLTKNGIKAKDYAVCVAPGAAESGRARMWPFERYAELCDEIIARKNAKIIFSGNFDEARMIGSVMEKMEFKDKAISCAGKITLTQLFYLMKRCNLFIGNDAGPMHIAAAQGIKTIGLFGPNIPIRFGPYGKGNVGLYKGNNCEFSPCINVHKGQVPDCLYPRNSNDYQKCMKNISVDDVLKEVEKMV